MEETFDIRYILDFLPKMLLTLDVTLAIVAGSVLFGLAVGFVVALPRIYRVPVLQRFSQVYVSFFRGTPILIQFSLFYYGVPELFKPFHIDLSKMPGVFFAIFAIGCHSGAYLSESIRAAIGSVDRGQAEAAYAIGMIPFQAFRRIVLPQAVAIAFPVFGNVVIGSLKDTSLAFTVGVMEVTGKAQALGVLTQHFLEMYVALSLIYFVICFALEKLFLLIERKLLAYERRIGVADSDTFVQKRTAVSTAQRGQPL
jgi:L-cystine transport system permease protein